MESLNQLKQIMTLFRVFQDGLENYDTYIMKQKNYRINDLI